MMFLKSIVIATTFLLVSPSGICWFDTQRAHAGNGPIPRILPEEPRKVSDTTGGEMKTLSEGSHSEVTKPFLAVARDPVTYSQLRKLAPVLPELRDDFFKERLVVAAFMGERNTGGHSVEMTGATDGVVRVAAHGPAKGAMVTQVITTPFKVVTVPNHPWLGVEAGNPWQDAMTTYHLTRGEFTSSGGFAGRSEEYGLKGKIGTLREGNLGTFVFDLRNSEGKKERYLRETITGIVAGRQITIHAMDAGELIEVPHGDLSATGRFGHNQKSIELNFISLPTMIADGYGGRGSLEADAVAAEKPKSLVKRTRRGEPAFMVR